METFWVKTLKELWEANGQGTVSLDFARNIDRALVFVMGAHSIQALSEVLPLLLERSDLPVLLSGGPVGLGTGLLIEEAKCWAALHGFSLGPADFESEAHIMRAILVRAGVADDRIIIEPHALHSGDNFVRSVRFFRLFTPGTVLIVQHPVNRLRALEHAKTAFKNAGLLGLKPETLDIPRRDPASLCEAELVREGYRLFGLKVKPASERAVCEQYAPAVLATMGPALVAKARHAEQEFHAWLTESPLRLQPVLRALEVTDPSLK